MDLILRKWLFQMRNFHLLKLLEVLEKVSANFLSGFHKIRESEENLYIEDAGALSWNEEKEMLKHFKQFMQ